MKLFSTVFRQKRGVILFVAAFLLPLIFVVLAGIDTFSKRQKTTRNLLESNLWLSGRSALEQLEQEFSDLEKNWLNVSHFKVLLKEERTTPIHSNPYFFLIDTMYRIHYPVVANNVENDFQIVVQNRKSGYKEAMEMAKLSELGSATSSRAIENYQKSLELAQTKQQEALAVEGLARTNFRNKNYKKAIQFYRLLYTKYSQTVNLARHPYGLTAPLQLQSIGYHMGKEIFGSDSLLAVYHLMQDRHWLITPPCYFFFKEEYEFALGIESSAEESEFEKVLKCNQFVGKTIIPILKEKMKYTEFNKNTEIRRTYLENDDTQYIISFKKLYIPELNETVSAGLYWNLDSLKTRILPIMIAMLEEKTNLQFQLEDNNDTHFFTQTSVNIPNESLKLSFNKIPFPWSMVAIQPGYQKLESDAKREVIIYGFLIAIIIALMLFAVFALLRDITRETNSMILQTEFVHNVSHELKTPLSLIRLYGETLLLKDHLPEVERKDGLEIITKESERLSYMINNILDFSKIDMGRKEFDMKPEDLSEVVINTLDSYRYHLLKKGFKIDEYIEPDLPQVVFDKNAVEGILVNLFSNAIKFSSDNKEINIRLWKNPKGIHLEVSDKGIGIPANELKHIFDRFYRVKSNAGFEARGSGLGLTLVKHVLDAHKWQISVKSAPGKGSTFSLFIPLKH
ncbi:ATP-binding protein [Prolixibacteraceae bacterium Z1-6]|uniref:histidine kinase n=1 Tax=Draconibacterium aestuarii TaxID=2998507 RepID=A0A9X3FGA0_9BACT|nr:ATP-binding protein [Prolixibacteraceae bacterium Z1-6]